ncbi:MAG: hypothetical protein K0Q72_3268, partial [Armatimonadetes bacterium]|nr:hypothetical protein [Armatimonadota bacterium]
MKSPVERRPTSLLLALLVLGVGLAAPGLGQEKRPTAAAQKKAVTLDELAERVGKEGLRGSMHGANHALGTYVFTWFDPADFFQSVNFSLVPANPQAASRLAELERHQEVLIKGELVRTPASQPHLRVDTVEPGKKWSPGVRVDEPADRQQNLGKWLRGKKRLEVMVHAIAADGAMLAVEFRGEVVPVQVPADTALREAVSKLYRGDRIEIRFRIAERPVTPVHLLLTPGERENEPALRVVDAIREQHGQVRTVTGKLVLFPRSPVIRRTIYGVEERGPDGLHRYFTIFNFKDLADQDRIDALLQGAWDSKTSGALDGRNKYIQTKVRVRVTGEVNN